MSKPAPKLKNKPVASKPLVVPSGAKLDALVADIFKLTPSERAKEMCDQVDALRRAANNARTDGDLQQAYDLDYEAMNLAREARELRAGVKRPKDVRKHTNAATWSLSMN